MIFISFLPCPQCSFCIPKICLLLTSPVHILKKKMLCQFKGRNIHSTFLTMLSRFHAVHLYQYSFFCITSKLPRIFFSVNTQCNMFCWLFPSHQLGLQIFLGTFKLFLLVNITVYVLTL